MSQQTFSFFGNGVQKDFQLPTAVATNVTITGTGVVPEWALVEDSIISFVSAPGLDNRLTVVFKANAKDSSAAGGGTEVGQLVRFRPVGPDFTIPENYARVSGFQIPSQAILQHRLITLPRNALGGGVLGVSNVSAICSGNLWVQSGAATGSSYTRWFNTATLEEGGYNATVGLSGSIYGNFCSVGGDEVFIFGSKATSGTGSSNTVVKQNVFTGVQTTLASLPSFRYRSAVFAYQGKLILAGGGTAESGTVTTQAGTLNTVLVYDPVSNTYDQTKPNMPFRAYDGLTVPMGGSKFLVVFPLNSISLDGVNWAAGRQVWEFDASNYSWTRKDDVSQNVLYAQEDGGFIYAYCADRRIRRFDSAAAPGAQWSATVATPLFGDAIGAGSHVTINSNLTNTQCLPIAGRYAIAGAVSNATSPVGIYLKGTAPAAAELDSDFWAVKVA